MRLVAEGSVVPTLRGTKRPSGKSLDLAVRWAPALVDPKQLDELTAAMPGAIAVLAPPDARATTLDVLGAVVDAIVRDAAGQLELPAPPPSSHTPAAVAEAFITRLDGSTFDAPVAAGAEVSKRLDRWARPVVGAARSAASSCSSTRPTAATPGSCPCSAPAPRAASCRSSRRSPTAATTTPLADELTRLERLLPALLRPGALRRGQVYLSQTEAWELMTVTGPPLEAAGFEVRVPALVAPQAVARRCACSPSPPATRSSAPTSSATCAGRRCSTTSS